MRRTLVRAAIALYPPGWRRRYGPELEQLVLDSQGGRGASVLDDARTVAGLAAAGINEWLVRVGPRSRTAALTLTAGFAALLINAVATGVDPQSLAIESSWMRLSPSVTLGTGVHVVRVPVSRGSSSPSPGVEARHHEVVVSVGPTGNLVSITGAVQGVLNPKTGEVLSVTSGTQPQR